MIDFQPSSLSGKQLSNFKIPLSQLFKYSQIIQNNENYIDSIQKIKTEIEKMINNNDLKVENLTKFCEILRDEKANISFDEYWDLCKLSTMFKVNSLNKILAKIIVTHSKDVNTVLNLLIEQQNNNCSTNQHSNFLSLAEIEAFLSSKIEECLTNSLFGQLQISTIYRILSKSESQKVPSDLFFNFIMESIEKRSILFTLLSINELSKENFNVLYQNYMNDKKKHFYKYITFDIEYIKQLIDEKDLYYKKMKDLEEENKQLLINYQNITKEKNDLLESNKKSNIEQIENIKKRFKDFIDFINNDKEREEYNKSSYIFMLNFTNHCFIMHVNQIKLKLSIFF